MPDRASAFLSMVAILLCVAFFGSIIYLSNRSDEQDHRGYVQWLYRINHACGSQKPVQIDVHGSGWSTGPWAAVTCPDDTVQAIPR